MSDKESTLVKPSGWENKWDSNPCGVACCWRPIHPTIVSLLIAAQR